MLMPGFVAQPLWAGMLFLAALPSTVQSSIAFTSMARGLVRYLRPEVQDPGYRAPVAGTLDLGEAAVTPVSNVIPWPATLPEQVGAVQSILAAAPAPLGAGEDRKSVA